MPVYGYYMADLSRTRTASHGIINYSLGLLSALAGALAPDERIVVFGNAAIRAEFEDLTPATSVEWHNTKERRSKVGRLVSDNILSIRWARKAGVDLLHFPKGFIPVRHPRHLRVVATLHDDISVRYAAGYFGKRAITWTARYFTIQTRHSLRNADAVIAVSEFTKERLHEVAARQGSEIAVTYEGVLPSIRAHEATWPKKPQLLILSSPYPHKQTPQTVEYALRYIRESDRDLGLLVLGKIVPSVEMLIAGNPAVVHEPRLLSSVEVIDHLAASAALLFGSSYEGFGLPPLEAGLLATPVIYRRSGAVEEIMNGTHFPFDGGYAQFAVALDAGLAAPQSVLLAFRETLRQRFDWADIVDRTLQVYRSVI